MWGLPEATKKGDFPHLFNTHSNLDYVGPMPPLSMWQPGFKSTKGKETIAKWHAECVAADYVWDNRKELVDYCMMDVQILRDSLLRYRELFLGSLEVDPLTFSTLSSCVMATFQSRFLEANQRYMEGSAPQKIWGLRRGCEADLKTVKNDRNRGFLGGQNGSKPLFKGV